MIEYNRAEPLIVIHIPKAAGTTTHSIFKTWFNEGFLSHYFDNKTGQLPQKHELSSLHSYDSPVMIYGHFNKDRGFGVEDYYPDVKQFITILRDPFEQMVSNYFYVRKYTQVKDQCGSIFNMPIKDHLLNIKPNMLNQFPREVSMDNFRDIVDEYFIEIGITEFLDESMKRISAKLNMHYEPSMVGHYNATERDMEVPSYLKNLFMENNPLEFAVYNYVLKKYI